VLSMPPIINSNREWSVIRRSASDSFAYHQYIADSKITLNTTNIFIDVTATDQTKLYVETDFLVEPSGRGLIDCILVILSSTSLWPCSRNTASRLSSESETPSSYFGRTNAYVPCSRVEPVKITYHDGSSRISPQLTPRATQASISYINAALGLKLSPEEMAGLLNRMSLAASPSAEAPTETLDVFVPCTRSDILHECDIMEDVGIAYGFNNLPTGLPQTSTVAKPFAINKLADVVRKECAMAGWVEVLPLILVSHDGPPNCQLEYLLALIL